MQTRRVPAIVERNNLLKKRLIATLGEIPGVSFAHLPDPDGDSATFLNLLLPDTDAAQRTVEELNAAGVGRFQLLVHQYVPLHQSVGPHQADADGLAVAHREVWGTAGLQQPRHSERAGR